MTKEEREVYRQHVKRWERLGPVLEQMRIQEMRSPEYGKNWRSLDSLLEMAALQGQPRMTTGLVQQQQFFAKARKK